MNQISTLMLTILILVVGTSIHAQNNISLQGVIYDSSDGSSINGAKIWLENSGYRTESDSDGKYRFENLIAGEYNLIAEASGCTIYDRAPVVIRPSKTTVNNIYLECRVQPVGSIKVISARESLSSSNAEILFRDDIVASGADNIPALLNTVPGIIVRRTGTVGGEAQVRIRGAASDQILVLVDGQKLNPAGNGIANLNTIPLAMVERVEIHKGGASAIFGPDAMGGVINIITRTAMPVRKSEIKSGGQVGKWNTEKIDIIARNLLRSDKYSARFAYSQIRSDGNFDYRYKIGENIYTGTRVNNKSNSQNYFSSGTYLINNIFKLFYSGQLYNSERGLPGRASSQNIYALAQDDRILANSSLQYDKDNLSMKLDLAYSRYHQLFVDTAVVIDTVYSRNEIARYDTLPRQHFYSDYINKNLTINYSAEYRHEKLASLRIKTEWRRDQLDHTNNINPRMSMGEAIRNSLGLGGEGEINLDLSALTVIDRMVLDASVRYDYSLTEKDSTSWLDTVRASGVPIWSHRIGGVITKGDKWNYSIRASYGQSFHLPTMNALFWQGEAPAHGNPGLKPEISEHSEIGIEGRGQVGFIDISGGLTYFHAGIRDYIFWTNRLGAWQPNNLQRVKMSGHEDFVELSFIKNLFKISYQNTVTTAKIKAADHTIDRKDLIFTPHYLTSLNFRLDWRFLESSYTIRWSDKAYTLLTNTKEYDAYQVDDLMIGFRSNLKNHWCLKVNLKLYNIHDESYVLLTHYPMPGREWNFGFSITYNR